MAEGVVSIGVAATLGPELVARLAPEVERAGFHALWVNDTPGADALAALRAAAAVTDRLVLATGVLPVDRRGVDDILSAADGIPEDRLVLGIGSGSARAGALALVRDTARALRERTAARMVVGALGPRMRRLAAADADGALLSWLPPEVAAAQADRIHAENLDAWVALYVRTSADDGGRARRDAEAARYATYPAYAANFARLSVDPAETVLPLPGDDGIRPGLARYREAVDEVVLRAKTASDAFDDLVAFVDSAAAAL